MSEFEPALQMVLFNEGGLVDNPSDPGGITNLGISLRFYQKNIKKWADKNDILDLTVNDAAAIYKKFFWNKQPFCKILNQKLANRCFDLCVNMGQPRGITLLQKATNSLIPSEHLVLDGVLGPKTLKAINGADQGQLYDGLIVQATDFYTSISKHGNAHIFLAGWLNRLKNECVL